MGERMKSALLYGPHDLRVEEIDKPIIGADMVLIKIDACGICPSDVRVYSGVRKPIQRARYTLGHEWAGHIVEVGEDVTGFGVGDRVVPDWRVICGKCYYCRRGIFNYCKNLRRGLVKGGFCEYGYAIESNLRLIPRDVSYEEACFTEPLACCINGINRCNIGMGDDVVIVGSGPIGLMHLQLAKRRGARVISCDLIKERLEMAECLGADDTILSSEENPIEKVKDLTDGRGANVVIVAVGGEIPITQGIKMAGINGIINFFAGTYPSTKIELDPNEVHYKQLTITGSHDFTPHDFTTALELIQRRIVKVKPLISHILPLEKINEGFNIVMRRKGLKVIIKIS